MNKQCIEHDMLAGKISTHRKHENMVLMYRIVNHLIEIIASTILQPVGASRTSGHSQIPCAILQCRCLQFCFLPIRNKTVELSAY